MIRCFWNFARESAWAFFRLLPVEGNYTTLSIIYINDEKFNLNYSS